MAKKNILQTNLREFYELNEKLKKKIGLLKIYLDDIQYCLYHPKSKILKYKRGDHAHKKCSQLFIPLMGKIKINMKYKNTEKIVNLSHNKTKALLVPPKIWTNVEFLNDKTIVLVLADYEYDFKDYIETYKEFIAFQKRNK